MAGLRLQLWCDCMLPSRLYHGQANSPKYLDADRCAYVLYRSLRQDQSTLGCSTSTLNLCADSHDVHTAFPIQIPTTRLRHPGRRQLASTPARLEILAEFHNADRSTSSSFQVQLTHHVQRHKSRDLIPTTRTKILLRRCLSQRLPVKIRYMMRRAGWPCVYARRGDT
jgi:hypothetical protein